MLLVKKYGNRRLYDTEASSYVTMADLAARIRGGTDIRVVDAKTNEDLTQATLTQIIVEDRGLGRLLPAPLLTELIRMGDGPLAEFLGRYVGWALEVFVQTRQGMGGWTPPSFAPAAFTGFGPFAPFGGWPGRGRAPQPPPPSPQPEAAPPAAAGPMAGPASEAEPEPAPELAQVPAPEPAPESSATSEELADLRRELEELKRAVQRVRG